jgi:hypothetical protein
LAEFHRLIDKAVLRPSRAYSRISSLTEQGMNMATWKQLTLVTKSKVVVNLDTVVMIARGETATELTFVSGGGVMVNERPEEITRV